MHQSPGIETSSFKEGRAAPEAVMVDTRAAATAAMMPQAREAVETAGEVVGMAATPAEVATASSSHSQL